MKNDDPTNSVSSANRQKEKDSLLLRLEEAKVHYWAATEHYRKLRREQPDGRPHNPNGALALARQEESEALAEYTRVLRIFTELTVNAKRQGKHSVGDSNGV